MSKFAAFTALQRQGGEDLANAIADFVEIQNQEANKNLATKEDLAREVSKVREDLARETSKVREDMARMEANIIKEVAGKYNWLVAILTALGVAITLANKFL